MKPNAIRVAKRGSDARRNPPSLGVIVRERRPGLATIVADQIRQAIVCGELSLGEAISEDKLATRLGVSRTPVREALASLQLQGLVVIEPQRGSFVFQPTEEVIKELCSYRAMLEIGALRLAYDNEREAMLQMLRSAEAEMEAAEKAGEVRAAAKADAAFHEALFAKCGNRYLVQSYALISGQIGATRFLARDSQRSREATPAEHRAIIKAIAGSDLNEAVSVLSAHIANMPGRFRKAAQDRAEKR